MNPFTRLAQFTVARDAGFVTLAGGLLMLGFSFEPMLALKIGATVALVFSVGMLVRVQFLTEERLENSEVWRVLPDEERPPGEEGRLWALSYLEGLLLRAAKRASACAGALYCSALLIGMAASLAPTVPAHHFVNGGLTLAALR